MRMLMVWSVVLGFSLAQAQLLSEDFSGPDFPPAGWARYSSVGPNNWDRSAVKYRSEPASAWIMAYSEFQATGVEDDWLVTPVLNLNGIPACSLRFWDDEMFNWVNCTGDKYAEVATTGGPLPPANFRPVWTSIAGDDRDWAVPVVLSLDDYTDEDSVWVAWHFVINTLWYGRHEWFVDDVSVTSGSAVAEKPATGNRGVLSLVPASPNPFTTSTGFRYQIPVATRVFLGIYNREGRLMRKLIEGTQPAGGHSIQWDGKDGVGNPLSAGVYFVRLTTDTSEAIQKLVLVR